MKLYGFPGSPNTWKVRALIAHLGLPVEDVLVDLAKGEHRAPAYLALNPSGRTPTLTDGDFVLWESQAIMQYLAEQRPNPLWPDDAKARADIARWLAWNLAHWNAGTCQTLLYENLVKKVFDLGPPNAAAVASATAAFHKEASLLDRHLAAQPYLAKSGLSIADFAVAVPVAYAEMGGMPIGGYPHILEWSSRILALPAWRSTAPAPMAAAA